MTERVGFSDVLRAELLLLCGSELEKDALAPRGAQESQSQYDERIVHTAQRSGTTALCLSGGGMRSATFALGLMQGLTRFGLLGRCHYLSSVSGGGYIASWLTAWRHCADDQSVREGMNVAMDTGREAEQISGIRADSNYLTPQLGLFSADTWTVVALYVRNLLLNWMLFVPFFMGCLMLPRLCAAVLNSLHRGRFTAMCSLLSTLTGEQACADGWFDVARLLGAVAALTGLSFSVYGRFRRAGHWLTDGRFRLTVLLPLVASGALLTIAATVVTNPDIRLDTGAAWGALVYLLAWGIGRLSSHGHTDPSERQIEWLDVFWWVVSGAVVGTLAAVEMHIIAASLPPGRSGGVVPVAVVLGLSGFVTAYLVGELLYVGLASFSRKGNMDREWLARSSGWLIAAAVAWLLLSGVALYAPEGLRRVSVWIVTATGGLSGLATLLLGSSGLTAATKAGQLVKSVPLMRLTSAVAVIFAILLTAVLALLNQQLEGALRHALRPYATAPNALALLQTLAQSGAAVVVIDALLLVGLIALAFVLSRFININRFSMHALYRNRLVRAFLGSARGSARRTADPFTGFDPKDDLKLAQLTPRSNPGRLFHVINTALNVVSSTNRAWQERKAESFTMTRLHCGCGNPAVGYRPTALYGGDGGLSLGTAMAISGAAVSPNQGYNSSPLVGFLLMLFNVRLGWWLGNPRDRVTYKREGPVFSLSPALRELAGETRDDFRYVYLSDGGHFENLGLYEMIRRRCRRIIVSDAGCDPHCTFEDLGNAVRKVFIDFGVSIEFKKLEIRERQNPPVPGMRFAVGSIRYPGSAVPGWLLYLKPTYQGTERADIRSYASGNPAFPHESTTDQWFSESQLESYRALGASIAEFVCSGGRGLDPDEKPTDLTLEELEIIVKKLLGGPPRAHWQPAP
jgi:hypothetical protein